MPHPKDPRLLGSTLELLYKALETGDGIRVELPTPGDAFRLKMRIGAAILSQRKRNIELFKDQPEHPYASGATEFDRLMTTFDGNVVTIGRATLPESWKITPL